jgi:hypothetical protein
MAHMDTVAETTEVRRKWKEVLREQGRTLTWLSIATRTGYPLVANYSVGRREPKQEWLDKVSEVLGEKVR